MTAIALWFPNPSCCKALLSLALTQTGLPFWRGTVHSTSPGFRVDNIQAPAISALHPLHLKSAHLDSAIAHRET